MSQPGSIDEVVHRHARAVLALDIGQLMKDLTPEAMGKLQASAAGDAVPALSGYEVLSHWEEGADHLYEVKYVGPASITVRTRWSRPGDEWVVVDAEVIARSPSPP